MLKDIVIGVISSALVALAGLFLSIPVLFFDFLLRPSFLQAISTTDPAKPLRLILVLGICLLAFVTFSFLLILKLIRKPKLKPRFGVYWDKEKNPYCPICKKLIATSYHDGKPLDPYFICLKCDIIIRLRDERGNQMPL